MWNRVPMCPIQRVAGAKDTEVVVWELVAVLGLEVGGGIGVSSLDQISFQTARC